MQLRTSLYLPVAATTSNRVRRMDRKIRYRSAEKGSNQHRHKYMAIGQLETCILVRNAKKMKKVAKEVINFATFLTIYRGVWILKDNSGARVA